MWASRHTLGGAGHHGHVTELPLAVLFDAADAATYAGVRMATLRVWRLRCRMTPWRTRSGANLYALEGLAEVLARRADGGTSGAPAA